MKTALGIDISETHVNTVVLKQTAGGLRILNAGRVPIGEGVIEAGRVVDAARLTRILKAVNRRHHVRSRHVALSLPVKSTLARVVSLEQSDPQRIVQFIQDEVRQYAAFSGRETVSDYRVLAPAKGNSSGKAMVAAADYEATLAMTRACQRAGIMVTDVEPAATVCASMLDGTVLSNPPGGNRVLAVLKETTLILCVFRNGTLDFVHAKGPGPQNADVEVVHEWIANEINAVIGFYNLQDADLSKPWDVVVIDDKHADVFKSVEESLRAKVRCDQVAVLTRSNQCQKLGISLRRDEKTSITAVGLAMRLLASKPSGIRVNLLPEGGRSRIFAARQHTVGNQCRGSFHLGGPSLHRGCGMDGRSYRSWHHSDESRRTPFRSSLFACGCDGTGHYQGPLGKGLGRGGLYRRGRRIAVRRELDSASS